MPQTSVYMWKRFYLWINFFSFNILILLLISEKFSKPSFRVNLWLHILNNSLNFSERNWKYHVEICSQDHVQYYGLKHFLTCVWFRKFSENYHETKLICKKLNIVIFTNKSETLAILLTQMNKLIFRDRQMEIVRNHAHSKNHILSWDGTTF